MAENVQILGLDALKRHLAAIPEQIVTKVLRKGVAAGAVLIKQAAIQRAPISSRSVRRGSGILTPPGTLRRSAIVKFLRAESNATQVEYIVTFRKGKRQQKKGRDAYYASWVEFGHGGKRAPPHRYLKPAFDANYHQALAVMLSKMRDELVKLPGFIA